MGTPERWLLTGRLAGTAVEHVVEISDAGLQRRFVWTVDDELVVDRKTSDDRVVLDGGERGALGLRMPTLVGPARRVTWWAPDQPGSVESEPLTAAHLGVGGLDLDPEPGSKAAEREAWIRAHPRQYAARRTAAAIAKVVVPLVLLWLLARVALPAIPWPEWSIPWPSIPWPQIPWPSIPWPDWRIPWPDFSLPQVTVPAWLRWILENAKYVVPVVIATVLAQRELKRRRDQDDRKRDEQERDEQKRDEAEGQAD